MKPEAAQCFPKPVPRDRANVMTNSPNHGTGLMPQNSAKVPDHDVRKGGPSHRSQIIG